MSEPQRLTLPEMVKAITAAPKVERVRMEMPKPEIPLPIVPKRFRAVRLETYLPETESERLALKLTTRWVAAVVRGEGPMLALIGPQGTGKSHLLYSAAWALHAAGVVARPHSWYLLADDLRYGDGKQEAATIRAIIHGLERLLLDEVRPTASTAFDDTELAKLACHFYDREAPVLLTTNVSPLEQVLGPAAASRFTQVTLVGRDRRQPA